MPKQLTVEDYRPFLDAIEYLLDCNNFIYEIDNDDSGDCWIIYQNKRVKVISANWLRVSSPFMLQITEISSMILENMEDMGLYV